VIVKVTV